MKDAYSFDLSLESMESTYTSVYKAYCKIIEKLSNLVRIP